MSDEPCNPGNEWTAQQIRQGWRIEKYISLFDGYWRGGKTRRQVPSDILALYELQQLREEVEALRERIG